MQIFSSCFYTLERLDLIVKMLLFVALTLTTVAHGWASVSIEKNKCRVRPGKVYTGKQLRKKCPDAFKCSSDGKTIKSGESYQDYDRCHSFSCNCGSLGKRFIFE